MFLYGLRRGCKGKKQNPTVAVIASLVAAVVGVAAAFVGKRANDDGPPKEFPWLAVGIAGGAMLVVCLLAFLQWRRKAEERSDSDEGGSCSR